MSIYELEPVSSQFPETDNKSHGCLIINVALSINVAYIAAGLGMIKEREILNSSSDQSRRQHFPISRSKAPASRDHCQLPSHNGHGLVTPVGLVCLIVEVPAPAAQTDLNHPIGPRRIDERIYLTTK